MAQTGTGSLATLTHVSRASILQNLNLSYHLSWWVSRERMGRIREMGFTMKRIFMQLAAVVLAAAVTVPMAAPARAARNDELTLRVGLAYGSSALVQRQFGERVAMNSPIQGTAADIMKIAMIAVDRELRKRGLSSRIVLQIHDELLIETANNEVEEVKEILTDKMKHAADLRVSLEVDAKTGDSWFDAK